LDLARESCIEGPWPSAQNGLQKLLMARIHPL